MTQNDLNLVVNVALHPTSANPRNGKPTLEQYLKEGLAAGACDFRIRCNYDTKGQIHFYIHPIGRPGKTQDFKLYGNVLETKFQSGTFE